MIVRTIASLLLAAACASPAKVAPVRDDPRLLLADGRIGPALTAARAQYEQATEEHGAHSIEAALALEVLGEALYVSGKNGEPDTLATCERAVALERELFSPDDARLAAALVSLATLHHSLNELGVARPLFEEARSIFAKASGTREPELARTLISLAELEFDEHHELAPALGQFARAQEIQDRALSPEHRDVGWRFMRQAVVLDKAGEPQRSRSDYERALAIFRTALRPGHPRTAATLYNLGLVLREQGDYAGARDLCREALEMRKEIYGPRSTLIAWNLLALAQIHSAMGQGLEAEKLLEQALSMTDEGFGAASPSTLTFATQLASAALSNGHLDRAAALLERCDSICRANPGIASEERPYLLQLRGYLLWSREDRAGAAAVLAEAQDSGERAYGAEDWRLVAILQPRADLLREAGENRSACELLERAARIQEQTYGADDPELARILEQRAGARLALGQPLQAFEDALSAEAIARKNLADTTRGFEEDSLLDYASARPTGLDLAIACAAKSGRPDDSSRALDALTRSRALLLDLVLERVRAVHASSDPAVAGLVKELQHASSRLSNLLVLAASAGDSGAHGDEIEAARRQKADAERRLVAAGPETAGDRARSSAGIDEVRAGLPEHSALVSYYRGREEHAGWFAFVVDGTAGPPALLSLGTAEELDPLITRTIDLARLGAPEGEFRAAGDKLRERIWDPLVERLAGAERVFLVPDASLSFVDFASLPAAGPAAEERYLIETGPLLHQLTSERDLVADAKPERAGQGLLALGGADFDAAPAQTAAQEPGGSRSALAGLRFGPLPRSLPEVREITQLWSKCQRDGKPELLESRAATEAAFKRLAPGREVLHLATHGFFMADSTAAGTGSASKRGRPASLSTPAAALVLPQYRAEHPLLLAGLVLAGANQRGLAREDEDDGVLTSDEIGGLDLGGTRWAVLSACETGLGVSHSAEGVLGLRRAFLIAGVRTVITSLWSIDDELAHDWMIALYRARLERHLGTAEAMRSVGLEMLRRRREAKQSTEPASWAGFVATGDWR